MKHLLLIVCIGLLCSACRREKYIEETDDLNSTKQDFIVAIRSSELEEGPDFSMNYSLKTKFFSKELQSFFGQLRVYQCLPHDWMRYEGKTYVKRGAGFREVRLFDLFHTDAEKEFLRNYCENELKHTHASYLADEHAWKTTIDLKDITTYVINDTHLVVIFQRYVVGGLDDGPTIVKIPYEALVGHCDSQNLLLPIWGKIIHSKEYTCPDEPKLF